MSGSSVALWNANVWKAAGDDAPLVTLQHSAPVLSVAFDADGGRIVTGSADGSARIWDARTGRPLAPPLMHDASVVAVGFDATGRWLFTAAATAVRIWDARSGSPRKVLLHGAPVVTAAFDATDDKIATVAEDGFVRLWRIDDGTVIDTIHGLPDATSGGPETATTALYPHGATIDIVRTPALGAPHAWTWDVSGKMLSNNDAWRISARHRLHVLPDNGIEVTGDGGVPLALLPPVRRPISGVVVSPDGGYVAAFYADGEMRGVRLPASDPKEFIRYAREKVVPLLDQPELSGEERRRLGLGS